MSQVFKTRSLRKCMPLYSEGWRDPRRDKTNTFLGGVGTPETMNNSWRLSVHLNGVPIDFDIDMGAEVSVISETKHKEIVSPPFISPERTLRGPSNCPLPATEQFTGVLKRGNQEVQQEIFVVQNLCRNLLGRPAIDALKLAVRVGAILTTRVPRCSFRNCFNGLVDSRGTMSSS